MRLQTQCTQCIAHQPCHGVPTSKNFEHIECLIFEPASCQIFICQWLSCSLAGKYKTAKEAMKTTNHNLYYAGPWNWSSHWMTSQINAVKFDWFNQCLHILICWWILWVNQDFNSQTYLRLDNNMPKDIFQTYDKAQGCQKLWSISKSTKLNWSTRVKEKNSRLHIKEWIHEISFMG